MKRIVELEHSEARKFFLKEECYYNFNLPKYYDFTKLLERLSSKLKDSDISSFYGVYHNENKDKDIAHNPKDFENVNYMFLNNRDGKYSWRPLQLIHPALYVSLVNKITTKVNWSIIVHKFAEFRSNENIICESVPMLTEESNYDKALNINNWWRNIEQRSIELGLEYEYVLHTDISNCYGSIYTHSIAWALHTKEYAKEKRNEKKLIGNIIDSTIRDMSNGQTNGIPQGSTLMDFIAEIVLGYADLELSQKIMKNSIDDYKILRYRDDYRIFANNPQTAELITKLLTEVLIELGMKINDNKTFLSNNITRDSIKPDKLYWNNIGNTKRTLQMQLLAIQDLSERFPNSGSLRKALDKFYKRLKSNSIKEDDVKVLSSIITNILLKNPQTYPIASAIISKLLSAYKDHDKRIEIMKMILRKTQKIPNTGHLQVWLQRVTIKFDRDLEYEEKLCRKLNDSTVKIWNSDWLKNELKDEIDECQIINEEIIEKMDSTIEKYEVEVFLSKKYSE